MRESDAGGVDGQKGLLSADVYAHALDQATQAVLITDGRGRVQFWNSAATALLGYTTEEALGASFEALIIPVDGKETGRSVTSRITPDAPFVGDWVIRDKGGRPLPIRASISAIAGADGEPGHFVGVSVDVSEDEISDGAQLMASIAASSTDAIVATDTDLVMRWANDAAREVIGWSPSELVGQHIFMLTSEGTEARAVQERAYASILAGDSVPPFVSLRQKRDGTPIEVMVTLGPLCGSGGEVQGVSVVIRDVTEAQRTQRELQKTMEHHRARFDQVAMPQAVVDLEGRFMLVNDALCHLVGYEREELVGRRIRALIHPMHQMQEEAEIGPLLAGVVDSASYERIARHADGRTLPVLLDVSVLRDENGLGYAMAVFAQDLTEIRDAQARLSRQENLFRALNRRSSDASLVVDANMNLTYVSPSVAEIFGYSAEDVAADGRGWNSVHPDDVDHAQEVFARVLTAPDHSERLTLRLLDSQGNWRWMEETITNCLQDPDTDGLVVNLRDINEQVEAERSLRESEARYRAIVGTAQEGIIALSSDGRVLLANEKMAEIAGVSLDELYKSDVLRLLPTEEDVLTGSPATAGPEKYEITYPHPDGEDRIFSISSSALATEHDGLLGALNMVSDVTEARQTEKRLRWQAMHDPLTKLPNRALLIECLDLAVARLERKEISELAVLFLDLDQFKLVNDSLGHQAGDELLRQAAKRLAGAVRSSDTVARLGGDEFAVVCEDTDEESALEVAVRIQEAIAEPIHIDGEVVYVGASIGVALSPPHDPAALLKFSDAAMYKAKSSGSSNIVVFDRTLASDADRRLAVSNALREALHDGNHIELNYQPIVELGTEHVVGFEALLNWVDPVLGEVPSREIVDAAERAGLALALDEVVLRTACGEFAKLRRAGTVSETAYLSINVTARTLGEALRDLVCEVLRETELPADCLMLEITENTVMEDPQHVAETLRELRGSGVSVAIDDFGTGYSSLAHLQRLPLDVLKIDRSFVDGAASDSESRAITRSIVALAKAIGLRTVAEGVETREQAASMREIGCDAGQGFLWDAALPAASLGRATRGLRSARSL